MKIAIVEDRMISFGLFCLHEILCGISLLRRGQNFEKRVTLALASFRELDLFDWRKPVVAFDDDLYA